MTDNVYCTVSEQKQANLAIERMQLLGYRPEDVIVVNRTEELENLIRSERDAKRSTVRGVVGGFIAGILFGLAQLATIGHGVWGMWGAFMLPVLSGFGWALVGSIIGCSGLLVSKKMPARIERGFEKDGGQLKDCVPTVGAVYDRPRSLNLRHRGRS